MSALDWLLVAYAVALTAHLAVYTTTTARCTVCQRSVRRVHRIDVPLRKPDGTVQRVAVCHRCWDTRRLL